MVGDCSPLGHPGAAQADPAKLGPRPTAKSERRNRTLLDEWGYARPFETNNERLLAQPDFVVHYTNHRPTPR